MLEDKGYVGPADGAKPREVYENPTQSDGQSALSGGNGLDESEETPSVEKQPEEVKEGEEWEKV